MHVSKAGAVCSTVEVVLISDGVFRIIYKLPEKVRGHALIKVYKCVIDLVRHRHLQHYRGRHYLAMQPLQEEVVCLGSSSEHIVLRQHDRRRANQQLGAWLHHCFAVKRG